MKKAFSLIEVITVIVIIAVLSTLSVVTYSKIRRQGRDSTRVLHITQIQSALAAYHRDLGYYPSAITPGQSLVSGGTTYISVVPNNPQPVEATCASLPEYIYAADGTAPNYASYHIFFCLDSSAADLGIGPHVAAPQGIQ